MWTFQIVDCECNPSHPLHAHGMFSFTSIGQTFDDTTSRAIPHQEGIAPARIIATIEPLGRSRSAESSCPDVVRQAHRCRRDVGPMHDRWRTGVNLGREVIRHRGKQQAGKNNGLRRILNRLSIPLIQPLNQPRQCNPQSQSKASSSPHQQSATHRNPKPLAATTSQQPRLVKSTGCHGATTTKCMFSMLEPFAATQLLDLRLHFLHNLQPLPRFSLVGLTGRARGLKS